MIQILDSENDQEICQIDEKQMQVRWKKYRNLGHDESRGVEMVEYD